VFLSLWFPYCIRRRIRSLVRLLCLSRGRSCSWSRRCRWLGLIWRGFWGSLPCCLWIRRCSRTRWGRWRCRGHRLCRSRSIRYRGFGPLCTSCRNRWVVLLFSLTLLYTHLSDIFCDFARGISVTLQKNLNELKGYHFGVKLMPLLMTFTVMVWVTVQGASWSPRQEWLRLVHLEDRLSEFLRGCRQRHVYATAPEKQPSIRIFIHALFGVNLVLPPQNALRSCSGEKYLVGMRGFSVD